MALLVTVFGWLSVGSFLPKTWRRARLGHFNTPRAVGKKSSAGRRDVPWDLIRSYDWSPLLSGPQVRWVTVAHSVSTKMSETSSTTTSTAPTIARRNISPATRTSRQGLLDTKFNFKLQERGFYRAPNQGLLFLR